MEERKVKASKDGVTLALIVSRNFSLRDDSLLRERDKRARLGRKKRRNRFIFLPAVSSPPAIDLSLLSGVACAAPKRGATFPQRGIYNFDSFSLIARNSGIRINNCFCRKFYCVSPRVRECGIRIKERANGFMAKKFLRLYILARSCCSIV